MAAMKFMRHAIQLEPLNECPWCRDLVSREQEEEFPGGFCGSECARQFCGYPDTTEEMEGGR